MDKGSKFVIGIILLLIILLVTGAFLFATNIKQSVSIKEEVQNEITQNEMIIDPEVTGNKKSNDSILYEDRVNDLENKIAELENQVQRNESELNKVRNNTNMGLISFLFGGFCALWAQNTGRSAWLWFFAGGFFNVFAVIALLMKNSEDKVSYKG